MAEINPCDIIGEVLGKSADRELDLTDTDYHCPFINSRCTKRSQRVGGPYPVCSVYKGPKKIENLITVCPKRLLDAPFVEDVIEHCWSDTKPQNIQLVHEVKMGDVGMVDAVVAEVARDRSVVLDFVSVELQAIDITGSYEPAYTALLDGSSLNKRPIYGFNWANVRKRYITQLVSKGFYHQQWGTRIASVVQSHVFDYFQEKLRFDELSPSKADIVFLVYKYDPSGELHDEARRLILDRVVGTSHSSLMMQALYSQTPPKADFCKRIVEKIR